MNHVPSILLFSALLASVPASLLATPADPAKPTADAAKDAEAAKETTPDIGSYPKLPKIGSTGTGALRIPLGTSTMSIALGPTKITPGKVDLSQGQGTTAPSDAIVLFDGTDLSQWCHLQGGDQMFKPRWKIENGYMEVTGGTGSLYTIDSFGELPIAHRVGFAKEVRSDSQGRGNSGIKFFGLYEIQVLDSFDNPTYADGQAGAIYGQFPPKVNATRPSGEWQTYDILFRAPELKDGKMVKPAVVTVLLNGVMVHHAQELKGVARAGRSPVYFDHAPAGQIMLQDHGNPVRYRNIWIRPQ